MVTARTRRLVFRAETNLESYLKFHLPFLLSLLGQDLLIIGRQVRTVGGRIDLLAIDANGVIYIIELKLNEASPAIITQVLAYRRGIKRLNREGIIRLVADGDLNVDLTDAFQRHFGNPLPETVNESQVLMIIAASIHRRTAQSILELKDGGYSISAFRYAIQSDAVSLIPCCRDDQDMEALHPETRPPALRRTPTVSASSRAQIYKVHIDLEIRWFWKSHAQHFTGPIVTFRFVYEQYEKWVHRQGSEGLQLPVRTYGQFGRQLPALMAERGEWTPVYIAPGSSMNTLATLTSPPSTRTQRDANHWIAAYLRNPVYQASAA
ncbi:hypothetical protein E3N86_12365 [Cryobacterium sp. Hz7]|nr:hypothetical protein E3N86_12365 [Cryobacterium sp. Hz7]